MSKNNGLADVGPQGAAAAFWTREESAAAESRREQAADAALTTADDGLNIAHVADEFRAEAGGEGAIGLPRARRPTVGLRAPRPTTSAQAPAAGEALPPTRLAARAPRPTQATADKMDFEYEALVARFEDLAGRANRLLRQRSPAREQMAELLGEVFGAHKEELERFIQSVYASDAPAPLVSFALDARALLASEPDVAVALNSPADDLIEALSEVRDHLRRIR